MRETSGFNVSEVSLSDAMAQMWGHFAASGAPTTSPQEWAQFTNESNAALRLGVRPAGTKLQMESFPRQQYCSFWERLVANSSHPSFAARGLSRLAAAARRHAIAHAATGTGVS